jgi:tartrate dehydrogenase/decarboxylase/D-malate dehydrogenase
MMLDWLGHPNAATAVLRAVESTLEAGPKGAPLTRDIGGQGSTADLGRAIASLVAED